MTQEHDHPITPPRELMQQWIADSPKVPIAHGEYIATQAARWGADQELEACCDTLRRHAHWDLAVCELVADRRPKPPSLKEQALEALMTADGPDHPTPMLYLRPDAASIIRRAIESIPDPS